MHGFDIKNSGEISRWHFLHSRYCMLKILFGDMTHLQAETLLGKLFLKSYIRVKTWNILRNVWDDDIVDRRYCRPLWCFFYWTILQMLAESWRSQWLGRTGYNYVDLCIRQTRTLVTLDPIPKRDGGGAQKDYVTFYPWIKSRSGYTCHSAETAQHYLPPGSWERDLQQMDGLIPEGSASQDGFLYAG